MCQLTFDVRGIQMSWFNILKEYGYWEKYNREKAQKRNKKLMDEGVHARTSTRWLNSNSVYDDRNRYGEDFRDKTGHQPKTLGQYNTSETMLFDIFNVPIEALGQLAIPKNLVRNMKREYNLDKLDEQKFNELMQLSDKREYQELVDKLTEIFNIRLTQNDMYERRARGLR